MGRGRRGQVATQSTSKEIKKKDRIKERRRHIQLFIFAAKKKKQCRLARILYKGLKNESRSIDSLVAAV